MTIDRNQTIALSHRRPTWRISIAMAMLSLATAIAATAPMPAAAQSNGAALIYEPTQTLVSGETQRLRIDVITPQPLPSNTYLRIRGLPDSVTLNEGHRAGATGWAVPLSGLAELTISSTPDARGSSAIALALVTLDGVVLVEGRIAFSVEPAAVKRPPTVETPGAMAAPAPPVKLAPPLATTLVAPVEPVAPVAPAFREPPAATKQTPISDELRQQIVRLLERGDTELREGNVATARLFFERAVALRSDRAALALAKTFDPFEMAALGAVGPKPDTAEARRWYLRAKELGATDADWRIARLARP